MHKYKGVIFDLDGTLVNSIQDIGESMNRSLKRFKYPTHELSFYIDNIGQGLAQLTSDSLPKNVSTTDYAEFFESFVADYSVNYLVNTKPYADINELVNELSKRGVMIGVNSNKKDELTKAIVEKLFSNISFTDVLGDRLNIDKKPSPISANEIIEQMNIDKSLVVYVGDTQHDMHTASNANIDSIGVSWGYRTIDQLKEAGATHIVNEPLEILEFF